MEDKLKLAEIKGYIEGCLNRFSKKIEHPTERKLYEDLNFLLDIVVDKQSDGQVIIVPATIESAKTLESLAQIKKESTMWQQAFIMERSCNADIQKVIKLLKKENDQLKSELEQIEEELEQTNKTIDGLNEGLEERYKENLKLIHENKTLKDRFADFEICRSERNEFYYKLKDLGMDMPLNERR